MREWALLCRRHESRPQRSSVGDHEVVSFLNRLLSRSAKTEPDPNAVYGHEVLEALQALGWRFAGAEVPLPRSTVELFHIGDDDWERSGVVVGLMGATLHLQGAKDQPLAEMLLRPAAGGPTLTARWPLTADAPSQTMREALEAAGTDEAELQATLVQVRRAIDAVAEEAQAGSADRSERVRGLQDEWAMLDMYRLSTDDEDETDEAWPPVIP